MARPPLQPAPLPAYVSDIGWYMDSNRGIAWEMGVGVMGVVYYGNPGHVGTFIKEMHAGLGCHLSLRPDPAPTHAFAYCGRPF